MKDQDLGQHGFRERPGVDAGKDMEQVMVGFYICDTIQIYIVWGHELGQHGFRERSGMDAGKDMEQVMVGVCIHVIPYRLALSGVMTLDNMGSERGLGWMFETQKENRCLHTCDTILSS